MNEGFRWGRAVGDHMADDATTGGEDSPESGMDIGISRFTQGEFSIASSLRQNLPMGAGQLPEQSSEVFRIPMMFSRDAKSSKRSAVSQRPTRTQVAAGIVVGSGL